MWTVSPTQVALNDQQTQVVIKFLSSWRKDIWAKTDFRESNVLKE